jgi:hypothetical protein
MSRRVALPDVDPSIALAQAARQDFEHGMAHRPAVDQPIQRDKIERAGPGAYCSTTISMTSKPSAALAPCGTR